MGERVVIAMVLAAGRGERLRPLTDEMPKALVDIDGRSLLERHLDQLGRAGITDVVINLGWFGEQIVDRVRSGADYGLTVVYSDERDGVLETGGGIQRALPLLGDEPFLVINADVLTDMPLPESNLDDTDLGCLSLIPNPPYKDAGDFDCVIGRIRNEAPCPYTFSGIAIYRPEFFSDATPGRFSLAPMLRRAADLDQLKGVVYDGIWQDVGTPERLIEARRVSREV